MESVPARRARCIGANDRAVDVRRQRSDANQPEVVKRYRNHGCSVLVLSQGHSVDLLVGCRGVVDQLVEVKDGEKPPSARQLTDAEQEFQDEWRGRPVITIESNDDVDKHVQAMRNEALAQMDIARV